MTNHRALIDSIAARTATVAVIGQGYVGLPVAMRAAQLGFPVIGFDVAEDKIAALASGNSYVEDVSGDEVAKALANGYRPTADPADLAGFDVAVISVPTPLREGQPDLSYIESAATMLSGALTPGALVVLESTTFPGTTQELVAPLLEKSGLAIGRDFLVGYSPERIDPGNPTWTLVNTPKVVSGVDEASTAAVAAFYGALVDQVVLVPSTAEAELVKLLENTFRHVNIALVNELAMFAGELGVDVWSAIDAASTKPFGFMRFTPGPGVGGHCLPVDPSYLSWRVKTHLGQTFRFVELANDVNEHMPDYVVRRVQHLLNGVERSVKGTRIVLLGMTYKAGTSDWRESPSIEVTERLRTLGADLVLCDPHLTERDAKRLGLPCVGWDPSVVEDADLVVVLVDHPEFDPQAIARAPLVFDTKGIMRHVDFRGELL